MPDTAPVTALPSDPADLDAGSHASQTGLGHFAGLIRSVIPPMHPGGRPIVAGVAGAALLTRAFTGRGTLLGTLVTAGIAAFFREPKRVTPMRAGIVVAPADGLVSTVGEALPPPELGLTGGQRVPIDARVVRLVHRPGLFLSADLDKASDDNERTSMLLHGTDGHELAVVQIAGLLARRIVCQVGEGDEVAAGQTYGLIRFGSRVDTYLPAGSTVLVEPGQRTIGGETVIAELPSSPAPSTS
jgi:phosphatidylserine decarboxylase